MTAMRRGRCPTVFEPMPTGDGLLARIKPPFATLSAAQARAVASAARRYGNGMIGLTSRANLHVRGLHEATCVDFAREMVAASLALADPIAERRRNVLVSPLVGVDPDLAPGTREVAALVAGLIVADPRFACVGAKFSVVVDGGGAMPLGDIAANLRLSWDGNGWVVSHNWPGTDAASGMAVGPLVRGFAVAPAFGMMTAAMLDELADEIGEDGLRLTPWRTLIVPGRWRIGARGFITAATDPRLRVVACPGAPFCACATVETIAQAQRLADEGVSGHVSGCAKGCAHPGPAPVTMVGRAGRFVRFDNGRAADAA